MTLLPRQVVEMFIGEDGPLHIPRVDSARHSDQGGRIIEIDFLLGEF